MSATAVRIESDSVQLNEEGDSPALTSLIDASPVVAAPSVDPKMTTVTLHTFMTDLAQNIHSHHAEVATRYGFSDVRAMLDYLKSHPEVVRKIKERKAIWESDDAAELRIRKLSGHAVLDALRETSQIMMDPGHSASTRLDALKQHARMAGADGPGREGREAGVVGTLGAGRFSINIVFPNAGKTESFTTVVKPEHREPVIIDEDQALEEDA